MCSFILGMENWLRTVNVCLLPAWCSWQWQRHQPLRARRLCSVWERREREQWRLHTHDGQITKPAEQDSDKECDRYNEETWAWKTPWLLGVMCCCLVAALAIFSVLIWTSSTKWGCWCDVHPLMWKRTHWCTQKGIYMEPNHKANCGDAVTTFTRV